MKSITVINHLNETITMELSRPEKSGLIVLSVDGLDSGTANINISTVVTQDGGFFNSARRGTRNIVFELQFLDNGIETIEQIREKTYKYFPVKKQLQIQFEKESGIYSCFGYVESNQTTIFEEETGTQISIICQDPNFYDLYSTNVVFSGNAAMFEFPFPAYDDISIISEYTKEYSRNIFYNGSSETGFTIELTLKGSTGDIVIYNADTREQMYINVAYIETIFGSFKDGDILRLSTLIGNKYLHFIRNGEIFNILEGLANYTNFLFLRPGNNVLAYYTELNPDNIEFKISFYNAYEGI